MSVEFRQRKPGEYLNIIRKRKWLIILPMIAITTAVAYVVYRLPDVYESTTLIVVTSSTLPNNVVQTATEDSLTRQLSSINQIVTSRSSLETLVEKYSLYKSERLRGEPIESVIALMRKDINVEVNTSRNDITNGFNITFRGRDPKTTQAVTAELASKYIDEQTRDTSHRGQSAKEFMSNQVLQAKQALDAIDKKRLDFMTANAANLPSSSAALISQLTGLREQQKALITDIGRLQDQKSSNQTSLALVKKNTEQQKADISETTTDPKTTLAWSQLVTRKAALEGELTRLKQELREKHPDVIAKQKEVEQVQKDMDDMIAEWKDKIKAKEEKLKNAPDMQALAYENSIKQADGEIKREQQQLADNEKQINLLVERLNNIPGAEVALGALEREYETSKASYDQLLAQQTKINLGADAASAQQSEGIAVVDAANLPSKPVAPKRLMLSAIGLVLGLGIGLVLTGVFEIPRLLTIQSSEDVLHYTGLPVLISVPELLTPQEARAVPRRRRLLLAAGMAVTIVSIPLLAIALKLTHVFELIMQSSGKS
jgi:polysaccharide chain length determinant protein (PEP-CTERM system associated)